MVWIWLVALTLDVDFDTLIYLRDDIIGGG